MEIFLKYEQFRFKFVFNFYLVNGGKRLEGKNLTASAWKKIM